MLFTSVLVLTASISEAFLSIADCLIIVALPAVPDDSARKGFFLLSVARELCILTIPVFLAAGTFCLAIAMNKLCGDRQNPTTGRAAPPEVGSSGVK